MMAGILRRSVGLMTGMAALALAGCSGGEEAAERSAPPPAAAGNDGDIVAGSKRASNSPDQPPPGEILLAYSYALGIEAPRTTIEPMMGAHQRTCLEAGATVCQVLGSSVNAWGEDQLSAYLNIRAEPEWLATFRAGIATEPKMPAVVLSPIR